MASLSSLPNELLTHILGYLPSLALLRLLPLSLRIHVLIIHLLHCRINTALALENHYLTFECYPPGKSVATPILHCTYLGTWRRSDAPLPPATTSTTSTSAAASTTPNSTPIGSLYCHFRPKHALPFNPTPSLIPTTTLHFFSAAFTTPLTAHSSLVKAEPSKLFTSAIEVFDKTIYVPRPWLMRAEERTVELFGAYEAPSMRDTGECVNVGDTGIWDKDRILWIGDHGLAGLKVRVTGRGNMRQGQQQSLLTPVHIEPDVRPLPKKKKKKPFPTQ
ncbi:hypothetical protein L211DRAFT_868846 [Terfezia boudieri ATCC MYA-4762]|uniref:F-box domain-containing protein n=1 Tax=Terfezia boudieri ATCC MYA-4762 TaxID=1051890 RepID=A0A3N4LJD3_9PEZI|nr:hypothetical protein L211DRAFT_868846 [Terfezia boudieri ATCC MYA-4762]